MHEQVVHILWRRPLIGLRAETSKCHLVKVDAQRGHAIEENVETQIVLELIDDVWSIDVLLHDVAYFLVTVSAILLGMVVKGVVL